MCSRDTNDNSPTPKPLTIRPTTMIVKPLVKVWIAPPIVKTMAPMNRVPLRPMISPTRPAAMVVAAHKGQLGQVQKHSYVYVPRAPSSSTATIVPTSTAPGAWKYLRKWGLVMIPDMTLTTNQRQPNSTYKKNTPLIITKL